jgi:hypothetical protein
MDSFEMKFNFKFRVRNRKERELYNTGGSGTREFIRQQSEGVEKRLTMTR